MDDIILASQSPRRRDILTRMGLRFTTVPSNYNEQLDDSRPVDEVAVELALGKALDVAGRYPDSYVIGSDTIVSFEGRQLGKPDDTEHARAMIKDLSGKTCELTTSVVIVHKTKGVQVAGFDVSKVLLKPYDEQAVSAYLATGDALDKAGGFGVQSGAAPLIDHIEGDFDTIVGLPSRILVMLLAQEGIEATPVQLLPPVPQIL